VFCRDVGWRKPAPHIFTYALNQLQVEPEQCLFVGDNPLWDIQGPQQVGIQAVLLDRAGNHAGEPQTIKSLSELPQQIEHS
jgi:putative hydrolase of the HAD superfamily